MLVCVDGKLLPAESPALPVQNRSFKWGEGLFETMKLHEGRLLLGAYHFERLFGGMALLQFNPSPGLTPEKLTASIVNLCEQNGLRGGARVRLAVYRTANDSAGYVIETEPLPFGVNQWPAEGQTICLYPFARKAVDSFSSLKTANYLPYLLAHRYAAQQGADDALVLNAFNRLCDSSRANLFLVKNGELFTPPLSEGCINGVMSRVVLEVATDAGYAVHQQPITEEALLQADEAFLTNAIQIIRWVNKYKDTHYGFSTTKEIFERVAATIFTGRC